MADFNVKLDKRTMNEFKKLVKAKGQVMINEIEKTIEKTLNELEANIVSRIANEHTVSGNLIQSITYTMLSKTSGEVYTNVPYARYLEYGTAPHRPPFQAIYDWAKAKQADLGLTNENEVKSFAMAVVRKIEKKGTAPTHIWLEEAQKIEPIFIRRVKKAIEKVRKYEL